VSIEKNKNVVRAFVEAWNTRSFDRFNDLMADDAKLTVSGATISCNSAATRAIAEQWTTAFPDWHFELLDLIAEGDKVAARMPYSGTHLGQINDLAPTGRTVHVGEIVIFRVNDDGKIAEAWEEYDEHGMRRQLAVADKPAAPAIQT
jgi:C-1 hydroxylase